MSFAEILAQAEACQMAGDLPAAEQHYRRALAADPLQADAHNALGAVLGQQGRYGEATASLHRALELKPDFAEAYYNLAAVAISQNRLDEAAACWRRAVALKPDYFDAYSNLATLALNRNQLDEAAACYRRILELKPGFAEAHNNLGAALETQGKLDEAAACYRRAQKLKPDFAEAHNNLGAVLEKQGQLDEAAACWRRALEVKPDFADAHHNLGAVLLKQNKLDEAAACCRRAVDLKPDFVDAHANLATVLTRQGQFAAAIAQYRRTVELKPDFAEALLNLGGLHEELGEAAEAEAAFRAALKLQPPYDPAHARLATILRGKLPDADLVSLEGRLADPQLAPGPRAQLLFALAQVLDARRDYARAADSMRQANALALELAQAENQYDPADSDRFVDGLVRVFDRDFFARVAGAGLETRRPVFIVGLPRSGTTLIEQVLASHSRVHGAGELPLIREAFEELPALLERDESSLDCVAHLDAGALKRLAEQHMDRLRAIDGGHSERIVDKMPENYMLLGLIGALFPRATLIHCRRDLRDVAVSCWMTNFHGVRWANDPRHIAACFRQYRRLMEHWRAVLPVPIHEIDYEDVVADLEPAARKLVAACGLDWEPACLEYHRTRRRIRTASVSQVRQPIYRQSVARWKHYEQALADLFASLPSQEERPS